MRKPRHLQAGGRYHVCARANRKEMIMEANAMKSLFLTVLARAKNKYDFRVENFCIMGNHFHLIIQPINGANLSAIMQWILSVFAMAWNRHHNISGHVWGTRFFSKLISSIAEYLQLFRYIDENPIKSGLVQRSEDWPYGGMWHITHGLRHIIDSP